MKEPPPARTGLAPSRRDGPDRRAPSATSATSPLSAECQCGEVVFSLSGREGALLTCPWCERTYRCREDGTLELVPAEGAQANAGRPGAAPAPPAAIPATPPREPQPRAAGQSAHATPAAGPRRRVREVAGLPTMLVFAVAANVLAFTALYFLFPRQVDGTRVAYWGATICDKSAVWPELLALLTGHAVGFAGWVCFLAFRFRRVKQTA